MNSNLVQVKAIFLEAVEKSNPEERDAFLRKACGGNEDVRQQVDVLLQAHDSASLLDRGAFAASPTIEQPIAEKPGTQIGPYKLLQQIGEGGFGVVYMAEQMKPVRRKVALKIIKPGMDTKEVIARFEAERQALALMDHPNIAKVYDAGATESGRPYFAMELVKGVPLTEYCDKNHLPGVERLKLFVNVCHAVQHAHQKGIIHRDLKPSNVMVTLHDGQPVPKVIDFGVSKALSQQLTEKTLFTAYGQMIGTPAYMSPEQAEMSGLDIDTRSDIYSLGVLLYELLTGDTPFDKHRLRSAGYAEIQRIIREEEPVKPSTRITSMGAEASVVSSNRGSDPKKLGQLVRGDLDWIVMKALEKDRGRRYETANGFAADIMRFLAHEPVVACPPSPGYRFRKLVRRNKAAFSIAASVMIVLVVVAIGSSIAAKQFSDLATENANLAAENDAARIKESNLRVEAQKQTQIATNALADVKQQRERAESNYGLARSAVDEFLNSVTENQLLTVPGMQPLREELLTDALKFYEDFIEDDANAADFQLELARTHYRIGRIRVTLGQNDSATAAYRTSLELFERLISEGDERLETRLGLAQVYAATGRPGEAVELCNTIRESNPNDLETRKTLTTAIYNLGYVAAARSQFADALGHYESALTMSKELNEEFPADPFGPAQSAAIINNIAVVFDKQGDFDESLAIFQRGIELHARAYQMAPQDIGVGENLCITLDNVAKTQFYLGFKEDALKTQHRLVVIRRKLMFENQRISALRGRLAGALQALATYQQALALDDEASRTNRTLKDLLENLPRNTPDEIIELAIVYGALASLPDGAATVTNAESQADQEFYAQQSWETLQEAVAQGYRNLQVLKTQPAFHVLRQRSEFQKLVTALAQEEQTNAILAGDSNGTEAMLQELSAGEQVLRELIAESADSLKHQKTLINIKAATGALHIGLHNYEKANQGLVAALKLNQQILAQVPEDAELQLSLHEINSWQGELHWQKGELPKAHALWKPLLAKLEAVSERNKHDVDLLKRIANIERRVCLHYAEIGLWQLAAEYPRRNALFHRMTDLFWDARLAGLMLRIESIETYRKYASEYYAHLVSTPPSSDDYRFLLGHVMQINGLVEQADVPIERLLDLAQRSRELEVGFEWRNFCCALIYYQNQQLELAWEVLPPYVETHPMRLSVEFLRSMILHQQGRTAAAKELLRQTERTYREFFANPLDSSGQKLDEEIWWETIHWNLLRDQAWQVVEGSVPPDPGDHLMHARAYQLLGETELAKRELDAAIQHADDDANIWAGAAELLANAGDMKRSENAWKTALDGAGKDPQILIKHGEFFAKQDRWDRAQEAWRRALAIDPSQSYRLFEICEEAERWNEAMEIGQFHIDQYISDPMTWVRFSAVTYFAEGPGRYADYCDRMLLESTYEADVMGTERICFTGLLIPGAVELSRLPGEKLEEMLLGDEFTEPWFRQWAWSTLALWAYRNGEPEQALSHAAIAEQHGSDQNAIARRLAIVALAEIDLGNLEAARAAMAECEVIVENRTYQKDGPNHDPLTCMILLGEAKTKLARAESALPVQDAGGN